MSFSISSYNPLPFPSIKDSLPIAVATIFTRPLRHSLAPFEQLISQLVPLGFEKLTDPDVGAGLGFWLRHVTEQEPSAVKVVQLPSIEPPEAVNVTAVPIGTGLLNASAMRIVAILVVPSVSQAIGRWSVSERLVLFWSGMPVVTANTLDWVLIPLSVVAVTRTAVAVVPACTVTVA